MEKETQNTPCAPAKSSGGCGCGSGGCQPMDRRGFLRLSGFGSAAALFAAGMAQTAQAAEVLEKLLPSHLIAADKNLAPGWVKSLFERGERTFWRGAELKTVGMPVCGIGTGQLYLCGDGSLGQWEIFNDFEFLGWGPKNYARRSIPKPVDHGLAIVFEKDGKTCVRRLDETGFSDVAFRGEYPIGTVVYKDPELPFEVTLEAFSPFIPLNAKDSGLPLCFMEVSVKNISQNPIKIGTVSWLENPIGASAVAKEKKGRRVTRIVRGEKQSRIIQSAETVAEPAGAPPRETIVFANFEGDSYEEWTAKGKGFSKPAKGTIAPQQPVSGFEGKGLANSFEGGDDSEGSLLSPEFTISRRYINFLIGGGNHLDQVGMRLLVEDKPVRSATGKDSEKLAWLYWNVAEFEGKKARLELFDHVKGGWGHVLADQIEFADTKRDDEDPGKLELFPDYGTLVWGCTDEALPASEVEGIAAALGGHSRGLALGFDEWNSASLEGRRSTAMATRPAELGAGQSRSTTFLLAWHFPNSIKPDREAGHEYAARFADATAVADYAFENRERLSSDTKKWRDTWYDSTLPYWLLDRIHMTVCCLSTGTCQWWKNGRFWAWEGVVCCEGTCTHVWNYAHSLARLFPELERNVRERQDLGVGLLPNGLVGFRHNGVYAADGQCGTILKAWREHLCSADDQFLKRNWPAIKKALDYAIEQDANQDGLIENSQHNTYDIMFFGANTFVGALYLGALLAGEQMATEMGEADYAARLRKIYESGKRLSEERLWNGEYFIQQVDLKAHPRDQYADGCLSDQMFGQNWAHQTGLGYLYASDKVRKAMESVWKYNWAPDTWTYNKKYPPERPYSEPTEAGLFICTWPKSSHLDEGVRYRDEVWTGIEYQAAVGMIYEGMVQEGLAVCRAVHDRYHPAKRNPFNEVECSDFYARAMASWGVLLALSGFNYHGPKGRLAFAPRFKPEAFRCAFTAAEGWGNFEQKLGAKGGQWSIELRHGQLGLTTLELEHATAELAGKAQVLMNGTALALAKPKISGRKLVVEFPEKLCLKAGQQLLVKLEA